jgi:20S proteasome subunit beta 4
VAADASVIYSIMKFKEDEDKILCIDNNKLLCLGGPTGDRVNFGEFIKNNIHLYKYKNNYELDTEECAGILNFNRIRKK